VPTKTGRFVVNFTQPTHVDVAFILWRDKQFDKYFFTNHCKRPIFVQHWHSAHYSSLYDRLLSNFGTDVVGIID
tara:strand:+ start:1493 stop:1714 length:222 start_codon:yes stop_codon:yes gene_type:complete